MDVNDMADRSSDAATESFDTAVLNALRECYALGYRPTYFQRMLSDHGSVGTAKRLLAAHAVSDGFTTLWQLGRLDLSVEAIVLRQKFRALFTTAELRTAEERLAAYGATRFGAADERVESEAARTGDDREGG
jgi:hypothetical protein